MSTPIVCGAGYVVELRGAGFEPVAVDASTPATVEDGAVIVLDALNVDEIATLEKLLLAAGERRCIAVLARKWDGFEPVPLAAACRGIISGFGVAGVTAALREFEPQG